MANNNGRRFSLISPATRRFYRASRQVKDFSVWDFIHGYVYARWPYLYIGIGKGDHPVAKKLKPLFSLWGSVFPKPPRPKPAPHSLTLASETIADGYHGKVTPLEQARKLVTINQPIRVDDLEHVIPYVSARSIIRENPEHLVIIDCPCRSSKEDPCLPLDVCMIVGEPFTSFVLQHHPGKSRKITQEQALRILEEEDARGHVHHAFFKDAMLGRFYAICNCCACCCGAMIAHSNGTPMLASSGYVAHVDPNECAACETCAPYCQFEALSLVNGCGHVDEALCMGCGVCESKCPNGAISLERDLSKGIPLEIEKLMDSVTRDQ